MRKAEGTFSLAHEIIDTFENGSLEEKRDTLGELGSNLLLAEKKLTVFNATPFEILLNGLMAAKEINPAFEPKSIEDLSDENEVFVSVRPTLLPTSDLNPVGRGFMGVPEGRSEEGTNAPRSGVE